MQMHATEGRLPASASGTYSRGWIPDPDSASSPIPIPTRRIYPGRGSSGPGSRPDSEAQDGRFVYHAAAAVDSELGPPAGRPGHSGRPGTRSARGSAGQQPGPGPPGPFKFKLKPAAMCQCASARRPAGSRFHGTAQ